MFLLDSSSNIQCTKNSITECNNLDLMMTVNYVSKGRLLLLLLVYKIQRRYSALCIQIRHTHTSLCMTLGWHPDVHFTNSFTFLVFTKALPHCSPSRVNLQHYKHRHPGMLPLSVNLNSPREVSKIKHFISIFCTWLWLIPGDTITLGFRCCLGKRRVKQWIKLSFQKWLHFVATTPTSFHLK